MDIPKASLAIAQQLQSQFASTLQMVMEELVNTKKVTARDLSRFTTRTDLLQSRLTAFLRQAIVELSYPDDTEYVQLLPDEISFDDMPGRKFTEKRNLLLMDRGYFSSSQHGPEYKGSRIGRASLYRIKKPTKLEQVYTSFGVPFDNLCWSESQIASMIHAGAGRQNVCYLHKAGNKYAAVSISHYMNADPELHVGCLDSPFEHTGFVVIPRE